MPKTPWRTGSSNSFNERQPLLEQRTREAYVSVRSDLEAVTRAKPEDRKRFLFYFALKVFLTIVALVSLITATDNEEGVGSDYISLSRSPSLALPQFDFEWALWRAFIGGLSGAGAAVIQALMLMPLRTTLNYQHLHDTTTTKAIKTLYNNGSYSRYYRTLPIALIYRTLARFGDTAANVGVLTLLGSNVSTGQFPSLVKTIFASLCATAFRIILTPIDTICTTVQIEGLKPGFKTLRRRIKDRGITSLWAGALTGSAVSFVEHYFFFGTFNYLTEVLPRWFLPMLPQEPFIGLCAGLISYAMLFPVVAIRMMYLLFHGTDTKPIKGVREILVADGPLVLFGRGWQARIIERGLQGAVFIFFWTLLIG